MDEDSIPLLLPRPTSADVTPSQDDVTQINLILPPPSGECSRDIVVEAGQVVKRNCGSQYNKSLDRGKQYTRSQASLLCDHVTTESDACTSHVKCSNMETMMNLIKGTAGTGILTLPFAFKNSGLWVGLFLFLGISTVAIHSMHIVHRCSGMLEKRSRVMIQTYPDAVELCFCYGPQRFQRFAPFMRLFVNGLILVIQCGFCCVYIVWVAVNIKRVMDQWWTYSPDVRVYEAVVALLLLPYLMVKSFRSLAMFSAFANIIYLIGLIVIYQYILQDLPDSRLRPAFNSWSNLPMFFGTAIFSFENVCLIIPLRHKIKCQEDFGGWAGVLNLSMVITMAVYTSLGFYGYLRFGEDVAVTITLNLPQDQWLYMTLNLVFAVAVFLTVGIQFYVPINIIWPAIEQKLAGRSDTYRRCANCLTRTGLLAFIFLVAVVVPHIDLLISLVGSLCGSFLAIILPALIELMTLYEENNLTTITVAKDAFIMAVGIVGFITGSYTSLVDIVNTLNNTPIIILAKT